MVINWPPLDLAIAFTFDRFVEEKFTGLLAKRATSKGTSGFRGSYAISDLINVVDKKGGM